MIQQSRALTYTEQMIQRYCPSCDNELKPSDMNLSEGVALCSSCGSLTRLATLVGAGVPVADAANAGMSDAHMLDNAWRDTPAGCRATGYRGDVRLTASARSWGGAAGMLFFTLFWNGITSIFVVIMLAGFYKNLGGTIPDWAKGSPVDAGNNMSMGMCIFLLLFLTPFLLVGAATAVLTLVNIAGDVCIRIRGEQASASTGIGFLRWTSRFKTSRVRAVHIGKTEWKQNHRHKPLIVIEADNPVRFASILSQHRMRWLASASRLVLLDLDAEDISELLAGGNSRRHIHI